MAGGQARPLRRCSEARLRSVNCFIWRCHARASSTPTTSALDLIDRPHALVAALNKLEQFHAHAQLVPIQAMDDGVTRLLRSHPTAYERVGFLAQLAL
jgi:hypothetical protein